MTPFTLIHTMKQSQENVNHLPQNVDFITMIEISQGNCALLHFILFFLISQTLNIVRWPEAQGLDFVTDRELVKPKVKSKFKVTLLIFT